MITITDIHAVDISSHGGYSAIKSIASSTDGRIVYLSTQQSVNGIIKLTNFGNTNSVVYSNNTFTSVACSYDGQIVYAASLGVGIFKSSDAGNNWSQITSTSTSLPGLNANPSNPEIVDSRFNGYTLGNAYKLACDSTGNKVIVTTNGAASIYRSSDGGSTWSFIYPIPGYGQRYDAINVASNSDGSILYAALNTSTPEIIVVSKDSGVTWTNLDTYGISGPFVSLSTNSYGDFVYCIDNNNSSYVFYPTHSDNTTIIIPTQANIGTLTNYNDGKNLIFLQSGYPSYPNADGIIVYYSITNKYEPGRISIPCFKDDSRILCFKDEKEVYLKVQDIRKGDLVKTLKHGYVPVNMIGTTKLYNSGDTQREKNRLYRCSLEKYPELTEDLIITGCHSILEDNVTEKQREETLNILGRMMVTDNKYRLMACLDERATPYLEEGTFNIWHIALDNDNYYMNYGIYANGLLVETCSKRYLKELSNMTIIE